MKGIILAAGKGTRLYPITLPVCKPLLPVYDKPLIYYSMQVLMQAGIRDILIIIPPGEQHVFESLFGDGSNLGINVSYKEQFVQRGIADAFILGEQFIDGDDVCLVLGDNIFFGPGFRTKLRFARNSLKKGATIFGYYVDDPRPFGVVEFDDEGKAISIEEKPENPKSNYIVPGLYFLDSRASEIAKTVKPSKRGELEITSVIEEYLKADSLNVVKLGQEYTWFDAGNTDSLYTAAGEIKMVQRSGKMIACLEETALMNRWITPDDVRKKAESMNNTSYGKYLFTVLSDLED